MTMYCKFIVNLWTFVESVTCVVQKTVQEIIDTAKIEDVVGDFVNLKRAGSNLKGLCPFHNEKTPSFVVSPAKNLCKCFGCGKGGDPVRFIMNHENMSFPEALRYLAERYNIPIVERQLTEARRREKQLADSLFITNQYAADFFHKELMQTDEGKSIGLSYFKERNELYDSIVLRLISILRTELLNKKQYSCMGCVFGDQGSVRFYDPSQSNLGHSPTEGWDREAFSSCGNSNPYCILYFLK